MMYLKRTIALASLILLAAAPVRAADTVTIGAVGESSVPNWPSYIAASKGYFEAAGIKLDLIFPPSSAALMQQITAGSINMALSSGLVDPIRAIDKGASIAIVGIGMPSSPFVLLGKPEIKSLADLKGKVISIGGDRDITRIFLERMLGPNKVPPGSYDTVFGGSTGARFAALKSGAVDAAMLLPPFNFYAESAGFKTIGLTAQYAPELPFSGSTVNRAWAMKNTDLLKRVLNANQKGMDFLLDPANRDESIAIFQKFSKLSLDDVTKAYDFLIQNKFFASDYKVSRSKFTALANALKQLGDISGTTDVDRFVLSGVAQISD